MAGRPRIPFDPNAFLTRTADGTSVDSYAAGQPVFLQGDPANTVFYIQKGKVKVSVVTDLGKEAVVALLNPNEFFGEAVLAGQSKRTSTAVALSDSIITRIEVLTVTRLIHKEPAFAEMLIAHLLSRVIRVEDDLIDQLFNSSEKRLARLLLLLAKYGNDSGPEPVISNISQETLSQMIGTTRARVSHFMNKFRDMGFISYNGKIEVHASLLNAVLRDQSLAHSHHEFGTRPVAGDQSGTVVPFRTT